MKKLLYIITQSEWGGAQRYIFDLATNLQKSQEYEIYIASGGNGPFLARLEAQKLAIKRIKHLVRNISPFQDLMAYFELKKLLRHIKPDIVHLNSSKAGFLGALAAKSMGVPKIIYTAHGFVFNEPLPGFKKWLYKKIELGSSRRIDKIICVSEYDRQTGLASGIRPDKLITIHNGINPNIEFLSKEQARLSLRAKRSNLNNTLGSDDRIASVAPQDAGLPRNDKWIGCIANFYPTKGLDVLIQAMQKIDATLVLIGDGPERSKLEKLASGQGLAEKIFFTGQLDNASQYLQAFDLFVLPSRKEGLPYTILEAAAANIPIVATRVGGVPEIIQDGINGCLASPDSPDDLTVAIKKSLGQPLEPKISGFELDGMLEQTAAVYES